MLNHLEKQKPKIAYFVTAHGLGHAARACAVMQAMLDMDADIRFEVFTNAPQWFFSDSLNTDIGFHFVVTDVGMVQTSPFEGDITATLENLESLLPFDNDRIDKTAEKIRKLGCRLVVCDIAPMGIAVAHAAGLPGILIENFTWDWIYAAYRSESRSFERHIEYIDAWYRKATCHIQTEPVCRPGSPDLTAAPASRKSRNPSAVTRSKLGIQNNQKMVMLTMGGVRDNTDYIADLTRLEHIHFVLPGASQKPERSGNITLLPPRSEFFHPDLIEAADAVIGKAGYSTIAEVYQAGKPYGYVIRPAFRESPVLEQYIRAHLAGLPIPEADLHNGSWVGRIPDLIAKPRTREKRINGADEIARFILDMDRKDVGRLQGNRL